jgi:hypothetical protein
VLHHGANHDDHRARQVSNCHWHADVTEITTKTGNQKSYGTFVKMLVSAVKRASDSVCVDLLTYSDLEVLKAKRLRRAGHDVPVPKAGSAVNTKRYLILTYQGEFDKVHYPLPLVFEEHPDPADLKATIVRLRGALSDSGSAAKQSCNRVYVYKCLAVATPHTHCITGFTARDSGLMPCP